MTIPTVNLQSHVRLWGVCPTCGRENDVQQESVGADEMRDALGVEPWRGEVPVPEGFTVRERSRCNSCEQIVNVRDEEVQP